jgi:hypothetical protein
MHLKKQVAKKFIKNFVHIKKVKLQKEKRKKTCNLFYQPWLHIKTGYEMKELLMN